MSPEFLLTSVIVVATPPKLTIFFFAFLPQFVSADDPNGLWRMLGLSGVFMALTLAIFVVYGVFAAAVRRHVISKPMVLTWMRRTFGAAFVALAGRLALADR